MPSDGSYLLKSDKELKLELALAIQDGKDFLSTSKHELNRLKREHYDNTRRLENLESANEQVQTTLRDKLADQ